MIVCAGASMIDCILTEGGGGAVAEDISLCPGGEAYNEASVFAELGEEVCLVSAIGSDHAGMILRNEADRMGIRLHTGDYSGRTPVSLLTVDAAGNRISRVSKIHALKGYVPTLPAEVRIDFVSMGSLFRPPFLDPEICLAFAREAKEAGAVLMADTKMPKGTDPKLSDYSEVLKLLDFITPNEQEALYYTGASGPEDAARVFLDYGVKTAIIKQSEKGVYIASSEGDSFSLPAFETPVIDGIGAGDTFAAGFIHSLRNGAPLREAARFGSACAAVCVSVRGAAPPEYFEDSVSKFLNPMQ